MSPAGPTPRQLLLGKSVLLVLHLAAITAAVLPFTGGRRPIETVQYILAFPRWPSTVIGLLAVPLLLPVVIAALQLRAFLPASLRGRERMVISEACVIASICVVMG